MVSVRCGLNVMDLAGQAARQTMVLQRTGGVARRPSARDRLTWVIGLT